MWWGCVFGIVCCDDVDDCCGGLWVCIGVDDWFWFGGCCCCVWFEIDWCVGDVCDCGLCSFW